MRTFTGLQYESIHKAVLRFIRVAEGLNQEIVAEFNNQTFVVKPGDSASDHLKAYFMNTHARYAALVNGGYIDNAKMTTHPGEWEGFVVRSMKLDNTRRNCELLEYAERWAQLMEAWLTMYPQDYFWEFADECSFLMDISGHYEILAARAIPILKRFWIHGNELEEWYYRYILKLDYKS